MTTSTAEKNPTETHPSGEHPSQPVIPSEEPRLTQGSWIGMVVVAAIVAGVVIFGVMARRGSEHSLAKETAASAIPSVNVVYPTPSTLSPEIALPGNTQAFMDTPIYSRTNGYLKSWYFDIGSHVRKGQLMAQIETPEVDQQLQVAQADLKSAQANLDLANTTSGRYQNLLKTNSVSKQETDVAVSDAAAKKAAVDASMANVRRLEQLQSFEKVYAPFDGIVTARQLDLGALIEQSTSPSSVTAPLLDLAVVTPLRVYANVPQSAAAFIRDGAPAAVSVTEYPERTFEGTITRHPGALDSDTRTMLVEVDLSNRDGTLLPGMYAQLSLQVATPAGLPMVPDDAVVFQDGKSYVPIVRNKHIKLAQVKLGYDDGVNVQIMQGVAGDDWVAVNVGQTARDGEPVRAVTAAEMHL